MKVGETSHKPDFGAELLTACASVKCAGCGFVEHGIDGRPVRCFRCWSRELETPDTHYHLIFT